ncbi:MAG: transcription elongation factor subunit Spt4 [Candidatus Micrarchaeota archaeon]
MGEKACKNCRYVVSGVDTCPNCGGTEFTERWTSYVVVFDVAKSELAKKIGAKLPGKYAVRIKG